MYSPGLCTDREFINQPWERSDPCSVESRQNFSLMQATLCPELSVSEEFCDLLMGNLTPLLFPFLFPHLPYIIYIDK